MFLEFGWDQWWRTKISSWSNLFLNTTNHIPSATMIFNLLQQCSQSFCTNSLFLQAIGDGRWRKESGGSCCWKGHIMAWDWLQDCKQQSLDTLLRHGYSHILRGFARPSLLYLYFAWRPPSLEVSLEDFFARLFPFFSYTICSRCLIPFDHGWACFFFRPGFLTFGWGCLFFKSSSQWTSYLLSSAREMCLVFNG